jgi:hypothetical protein
MTADASTPKGVIERLRNAMNQHDLKEFLACIDPAYRSAHLSIRIVGGFTAGS